MDFKKSKIKSNLNIFKIYDYTIIQKKAIYRRENSEIKENFIYPYDLGLKENLRQVFNWNGNPRFRPIGDGIIWNVNELSDQFTLTVMANF